MHTFAIRQWFRWMWPIVIASVVVLTVGGDLAMAKAHKTPPTTPPAEKTEFGPAMNFVVFRLSSSLCEPLCPEWIAADGEITDMTPGKLTKLLSNVAYRKLPILINSGGGKIEAAMIMGRLIRKYGMTVAVAPSGSVGCRSTTGFSSACPPDGNVHQGYALISGGYCNSACSLILLGGQVRLVGPVASVGLHQPHGETQHWVDHYWDTWRMENGRKVITSHKFIKRTYEKPKSFAGVTPYMKPKYLQYFKEMGGSPAILGEMAKASPTNMNSIPYVRGGGPRKKMGLVTDEDMGVPDLVSADHCKTFGKLSSNCVLNNDFVAQSKQQDGAPCFIESGCGGAKKPQSAAGGVPCFSVSRCSEADNIATKEWLMNKQQAATTPCFIESGCSKADKSATLAFHHK